MNGDQQTAERTERVQPDAGKRRKGGRWAALFDGRLKTTYSVRTVPIWLRLLLALIAILLAAMLGCIVGYSIIGDGSFFDALRPSTWRHVLDIMNGN